MVFRTEPHVERAEDHLRSGTLDRLRYACLELRLSLERIAYQKLQLRLNDISNDEITAWQPKRVMDTLMELVDPELEKDFVLSVGERVGGGDPETDRFMPLGTNKGVSSKNLGKYWHKLGSFLHVEKPTKKGQQPKEPDLRKLESFLKTVIAYVREVTETGFDAHFSEKVTLKCVSCNQMIYRNRNLLKEWSIVQCQNPLCDESYVTHVEDDMFRFERHKFELECKNCSETMQFPANKLLSLPYDHTVTVVCDCDAKHLVRWQLAYANYRQ